MDKLAFPYRSDRHLSLLHVTALSGGWARHGLEVDYDFQVGAEEAQTGVISGRLAFVNGNHLATYGNRARGDTWVYLAQTVNRLNLSLVSRRDDVIASIPALQGRRFGTRGRHSGLNDWACLRRNGIDMESPAVTVVRQPREDESAGNGRKSMWKMLDDGDIDAAFAVSAVDSLAARRRGHHVQALPPLPTIYSITVSSSMAFVEQHPDLVERFLKRLCEGIAYFKTERKGTLDILRKTPPAGCAGDEEALGVFYDEVSGLLEARPYADPEAVATTHALAVKRDPDAARVGPLALWDFHALRRIDDSGFIEALYGRPSRPDERRNASREGISS